MEASKIEPVIHNHPLTFEPLIPNAQTIAAMKESEQGKLRSFTSIDDLMADLNAED